MAGYIGPIPVPQATQTRETFTATASQTTFNTAGYQPGYLDVFMNGVKLIDGSDYTATNGSDVVLSSAAAVNDLIEVVAYTAFEVLNQNFTGTTTVADLTVTGDLTVDGTTTTINSTTLNVDDINITVASGAADAAAANGAGLTVDGANATFNYASSGDKWTMNKDLDITGVLSSDGLTVDGSVNISAFISHEGDGDTFMGFPANDAYRLDLGGNERITMDGTSTVFNDDGIDADFRVESVGNQHMFFVDAANNQVTVGSSAGYQNLNVNGNIAVGGTGNKGIYFGDNITSSADQEWLLANNQSDSNSFNLYEYDSGTYVSTRAVFYSGGGTAFFNGAGSEFVINQGGSNADFRIESDNDANFFVADADSGDSGSIGIHTNSPSTDLDIVGGMRSRYRLTNAPGGQTGGVNDNYWKLGTLTLGAVAAAEITLYGTASYSSGYSIAGKTTILLRGGTSGTLLDGTWWYEGEFTSGQVKDCVYVPTGTANEFDIYVKLGNYQCFDHEVVTGGNWVSSITNTGSSSPPSGYQLFSREYSIWNGDNNFWYWDVSNGTGNVFNENGGNIDFRVESDNNSYALFVDASSDDVTIGKTTTGVGLSGFEFTNINQAHTFFAATHTSTDTSSAVIYANRQGGNGDIIQLRISNTSKGVIGALTDDMYFGTGPTGLKVYNAGNAIHPFNTSSLTNRDNAIDLGLTSIRFDDIYATNGTIQTSDENEKQQIASLTSAEITAAKAISKLFKTFKWNDKVEAKGDAARKHTGVIAQQVEQAMTDAGLDAGDYAFFTSTTWWEDAEGEQYYTADDAPEGATERTRRGIRYPELLSFIGAATEQRLASIESRLDALEA